MTSQINTNPWMPVLNKAQWPTASNTVPSAKGTQEIEWSTSWSVPSTTTSVPKQQSKVVRIISIKFPKPVSLFLNYFT